MMECDICGSQFTPKVKWQKRCSKECGYEAEVRQARERGRVKKGFYDRDRTKTCDVCGASFQLKTPNQMRCSEDCARVANAEKERVYREKNRGRIAATAKAWRDANRDRRLETIRKWHQENRDHEREYARNRYKTNQDVRARASEYKRNNRQRYTEYENRRRAIKMQAWVEDVDLVTLIKRKGFACGICGRLTFPSIKDRYHPLSVHIDHIVPLSKGGEHSYANCQVAHASCNTQKRDKVSGWENIVPILDGWDDEYTRVWRAQVVEIKSA